MRSRLVVSVSLSIVLAGCGGSGDSPVDLDGSGRDGGDLDAGRVGSVDAWFDGATPTTCGPTRCASGLVCCNESCGICAPPGESCVTAECAECGGTAGTTCPTEQYCDFPDRESACGADGASGRCRLRPSSCEPARSTLLCGCDGRDYFGVCDVYAAGTDVGRWSPCTESGAVFVSVSRDCAPDDGTAWRFVISSAPASCDVVPAGERIEITVWHDLGPPTSSDLGGSMPHGAARVCQADGTCVEALGHLDVEDWVVGERARITYELLTPDGVGRAAERVMVDGWCGLDPPGCG